MPRKTLAGFACRNAPNGATRTDCEPILDSLKRHSDLQTINGNKKLKCYI